MRAGAGEQIGEREAGQQQVVIEHERRRERRARQHQRGKARRERAPPARARHRRRDRQRGRALHSESRPAGHADKAQTGEQAHHLGEPDIAVARRAPGRLRDRQPVAPHLRPEGERCEARQRQRRGYGACNGAPLPARQQGHGDEQAELRLDRRQPDQQPRQPRALAHQQQASPQQRGDEESGLAVGQRDDHRREGEDHHQRRPLEPQGPEPPAHRRQPRRAGQREPCRQRGEIGQDTQRPDERQEAGRVEERGVLARQRVELALGGDVSSHVVDVRARHQHPPRGPEADEIGAEQEAVAVDAVRRRQYQKRQRRDVHQRQQEHVAPRAARPQPLRLAKPVTASEHVDIHAVSLPSRRTPVYRTAVLECGQAACH